MYLTFAIVSCTAVTTYQFMNYMLAYLVLNDVSEIE